MGVTVGGWWLIDNDSRSIAKQFSNVTPKMMCSGEMVGHIVKFTDVDWPGRNMFTDYAMDLKR